MKPKLLALFWCAALALSVSACKQGEGENCQIDDDCQSGLECNAGTKQCQKPGAAFADAAPNQVDAAPIDAGFDAGPADAGPPDGGIDASVR